MAALKTPYKGIWLMKLKIIAITLAGLFIASCGILSTSDNSLVLKGTVEAKEHYIRCLVDANIKEVLVQEGDQVERGQPLVTLDSSGIKSDLSKANKKLSDSRQSLNQARKNFARVEAEVEKQKKKSKGFFAKVFSTKKGRARKERELRQKYIAAKKKLVIAQKKNEYIKNRLAQGNEAVELFTLESPVKGTIAIVSANAGDEAEPGQILVAVAETGSKFFRTRVKAGDRDKLLNSGKGELFLDEIPKQPMKVALKVMADKPSFTPESDEAAAGKKEFPVELDIEGDKSKLTPGMRGQVSIDLNSSPEARQEKEESR